MTHYQVHLLTDTANPGTRQLLEQLPETDRQLAAQNAQRWGLFTGLLGLRSNQAYLVTAGSPVEVNLPGVSSEIINLVPTLRPDVFTPPDRDGVYVFRWFDVAPEHVDEIVHLSGQAWISFETDFKAEIQALFREDTPSPSRMLLITWYADLSVWEASRQPSAAARENFIRRHQLTEGALPIATALAGKGPSLASQQ